MSSPLSRRRVRGHRSTGAKAIAVVAGIIPVALALALLADGCASGSATTATPTRAAVTTVTGRPTTFEGHPVSAQAHMVCEPEAVGDLSEALGTKTDTPPQPGWADGAYTCTYHYADGAHYRLSVQDFATTALATARRQDLQTSLGTSGAPLDLGTEGAFVTANGNAVVQKDHHVLVVDVAGVPDRWPSADDSPATVARTIAATIMGCWMGGAS